MRIEVAYALAQTQELLVLDLAPGSTVLDAIEASGLLRREPQIEFSRAGIWGRPVNPETRLRDHDRVEFYRPLLADPKKVRRERAAKSRK